MTPARLFLRAGLLALPLSMTSATEAHARQSTWPQFRGPNGSGIAAPSESSPTEFGPSRNRLWNTPLPSGHSSPVIWGDRIFVTGFDKDRKKLEVIGLNRTTGAILWRQDVPNDQVETVHQISSPATATLAVDGEQIYAYFGSYGLVAYDFDGKQRWVVPMPVAQVPFGSGTSPIVAGELVILNRHEPKAPFIVALDRKTGKTVWRREHEVPEGLAAPLASYSTPLVVDNLVVVHGPRKVEAFDLATGTPRWWATVASTGTSSPVNVGDMIYVATWFPFGEADQRPPLPDYATLLKSDKDGNGQLAREEIPADLAVFSRPDTPDVPGATMFVKSSFNRFDANKDGVLQEAEWDAARGALKSLNIEHGLLAIKLGGTGDVTATNVVWKEKSSIPEVPSPLVYRDRVYLVRNGGIVTCMDARNGRLIYRARVGAGGPYFSSPVAVDGKLVVASGDGVVVVLAAGDTLNVLARNDLGESIMASPAIARGTVYIRTSSGLSAFHQK